MRLTSQASGEACYIRYHSLQGASWAAGCVKQLPALPEPLGQVTQGHRKYSGAVRMRSAHRNPLRAIARGAGKIPALPGRAIRAGHSRPSQELEGSADALGAPQPITR